MYDELNYLREGKTHRLAHAVITDKIRVSTAAIWRTDWYGAHFIVETWVFSADPRQSNVHRRNIEEYVRAHDHIVKNMRRLHNEQA